MADIENKSVITFTVIDVLLLVKMLLISCKWILSSEAMMPQMYTKTWLNFLLF